MDNETLYKVWNALSWDGPEDARVISKRAGLDPGRTCEPVRHAVRELRRRQYPIASSSEGFWKTVSPMELATCIQDLQQRAAGNQETANSLLACIVQGHRSTTVMEERARMDLGGVEPDYEE